MKRFKCKLSLPIILLTAGVLALSIAGIIVNIINITAFWDDTLMLLRYVALGVVCLIIFLSALSVYLFSYYKIKENTLVKRSGIFVESIDLSKAVEVCRFPDKHALVLYDEKSFVVINISETLFNDFVKAIREVNPQIVYDQRTTVTKDEK